MNKKQIFKKMLIEKNMTIEFVSGDDDDDDIFGGGEIVKLSEKEINAAKKICIEAADRISENESKGKNFAKLVADIVENEHAKLVAEELAANTAYIEADLIAGK